MLRRTIATILLLLSVSAAISGEPYRLTVAFYNDLHGHIGVEPATFISREFPPTLGGGASAATLIRNLRETAEARGEGFLLLDAGDCFQGTPIGTKTGGRAIISYLNMLGVDALVPGNHDYDLGHENWHEIIRDARFPIVTTNVIDRSTGEIYEQYVPFVIRRIGPVKVAIVGSTTVDTENMTVPQNVEQLDFLPEVDAMQPWVDSVNALGVDIVIGLVHAGLPFDAHASYPRRIAGLEGSTGYGDDAMEIAARVTGLDVVVAGHTHRGYNDPWVDPVNHTLVFESYGNGSSLGIFTLLIDTDAGELVGYETPDKRYGALVTLFRDQFYPDDVFEDSIQAWTAIAEAGMDEPFAELLEPLTRGDASNNYAGFMIVDAFRERLGGDVAFLNLGGVRAELPTGPLTERRLFTMMPFGNTLVTLNIPGSFLRRLVEIRVSNNHAGLIMSGIKIVYSRERENFDRITTFEIGGEPLDPERVYKVVTTDFIAAGNIRLDTLRTLPDEAIYYSGIVDIEAVIEYLKHNTPYSPPIDDRWRRDDAAEQIDYLRTPSLRH
jgi:5'-nucleotidase/UDP-sugar diphosphatase